METTTINFDMFDEEVFIGYENGKHFREKLNLEFLDNDNTKIEIIVSSRIYSMSSSFIRGLLSDSIIKAGNREKFYEKYQFKTNSLIMGIIESMFLRYQLGLL